MSYMDRDQLFTMVVAETSRADKLSELPDILLIVEARIARELRCREMENAAALTFANDLAPLPSDYLGARILTDDSDDLPLQQVGLAEFYAKSHQTKVYAVSFDSVASRVAAATLTYFARPVAMASGTDTTAVLDAHPDLYIALMNHYVFKRTQDLELAQSALATYQDARDTLNELADRQRGGARISKGYNFGGASAF
jgi:hypothetical protein